jgi:uncharacterized protein (DUF1697 family)
MSMTYSDLFRLRRIAGFEKNGFVRYLALLRGINIGGKNIVNMAELRACFERLNLNDVTTYIQSGNVLFDSRVINAARLSGVIEEALAAEFGCNSIVVVVSEGQLGKVVTQAPPGFGADPAQYRYDVVFLKPPTRAPDVLPISLKGGVDEAFAGSGVLYFSRLNERATQSHLPRLINHPAYRSMTIRNWNTISKLSRLIGAIQASA